MCARSVAVKRKLSLKPSLNTAALVLSRVHSDTGRKMDAESQVEKGGV